MIPAWFCVLSYDFIRTLELLGLVQSFSDFSDFEFLTGQHFSDFGSRIRSSKEPLGHGHEPARAFIGTRIHRPKGKAVFKADR